MTNKERYDICLRQLEELMKENQDVLWRMGHEWQDENEEEDKENA